MPTKPERKCDIVMKGGITSGVVYPKAIAKLSKHFKFKNVGGTSAGAIAAAATAAAEYRRVRTGSEKGFEMLEGVGDELSTVSSKTNRTMLSSLFLPNPSTRRVFEVFIGSIGHETKKKAVWEVLKKAVRHYYWAGFLGSLPGVSLALISFLGSAAAIKWVWITIAMALAIAGALIGMVAAILYQFVTRLPENKYGLCSGIKDPKSKDSVEVEPLTEWLYRYLNQVAGIEGEKPLTFGDLWNARRVDDKVQKNEISATENPANQSKVVEPKDVNLEDQLADRAINLEMMTTNLTHGRPYRLPFRYDADLKENHPFYFRKDEFETLFPASVVEWMIAHPRESDPGDDSEKDPEGTRKARREAGYYPMPEPANLPVIVATRMSLSFPVLLSIVPLHWQNYTKNTDRREMERCWFTDGGVCSNFPLHFFDSPLPRRPTFSLDLVAAPDDTEIEKLVPTMPENNNPELMDRWNRFDEIVSAKDGYSDKGNLGKIFGFAATLISTMQNWNDATQSCLPGYRDRITRIPLTSDQGGLNLNMKDCLVKFLAGQGEASADRIIERFDIERFDTSQEKGQKMDWENHRWIRLRGMLASFERMTNETLTAYEFPENGDPSYKDWLRTLEDDRTGLYRDLSYEPTKAQIEAAIDTFEKLKEIQAIWNKSGTTAAEDAPRPRPVLRPRAQI